MTTERRILFEPSDIEHIEFICKACGASLALDPSKENHFVQCRCSNCSADLMAQPSVPHQAAAGLLKSIRALGQMGNEAGFRVRLCLRSDEPK